MARYIPSIRSEMNPTIVPIRMATTNPSNKANTNGNPAFANANEIIYVPNPMNPAVPKDASPV